MTKAEARRLLNVKTDYELAKIVGRNRASVSRWGRMVPEYLREAIRMAGCGGAVIGNPTIKRQGEKLDTSARGRR